MAGNVQEMNRKTLDRALEEISKRVKAVEDGFVALAPELSSIPVARRVFHNLTGNTLTSMAAGVYRDGMLQKVVLAKNEMSLKKPTRKKLYRADTVFKFKDYDTGKEVHVYGLSGWVRDTDRDYGYNTVKKFLKGPEGLLPGGVSRGSKGVSIVVATGTEYSQYNSGIYATMQAAETLSEDLVFNYLDEVM